MTDIIQFQEAGEIMLRASEQGCHPRQALLFTSEPRGRFRVSEYHWVGRDSRLQGPRASRNLRVFRLPSFGESSATV